MNSSAYFLVKTDEHLNLLSDFLSNLSKTFWTSDEVKNPYANRQGEHREKVSQSHSKSLRLIQEPGHLKSLQKERNLLTEYGSAL